MIQDRVRRGEVYLVALSPTHSQGTGQEIRKTRPCVVVSPDELNAHMGTFIVAPLTTGGHPYPFRIACAFQGTNGHVVLDQLRTVDQERLIKRLGQLQGETMGSVLEVLQAMFAP